MVLLLLVVAAVIGGLVWFSVSSKDDSASASKSTTTTAASALTTTTSLSGLSTTSVPNQGSLLPQNEIPNVTPTLPAKATGSGAQLCPLAGQYRQALATFSHANDTRRAADAERVAKEVLPTFDQIAKAAPASVYEAVRGQYDIVATVAFTAEEAAALEKVAPGMGMADQQDMISSHYLAGVGDLSASADGKTLAAFFAACG